MCFGVSHQLNIFKSEHQTEKGFVCARVCLCVSLQKQGKSFFSSVFFSVFGDANLRGNPSCACHPRIHLHSGNFCLKNTHINPHTETHRVFDHRGCLWKLSGDVTHLAAILEVICLEEVGAFNSWA